MSIIAFKNNTQNSAEFLSDVNVTDYIDGIIIQVTMTKDGTIIGFGQDALAINSIETLQNSKFSDLQQVYAIPDLNSILKLFGNWQKRIVIRVTSLLSPILSTETLQEFNQRNTEYIVKLNSIINNYRNLNISLHSVNNHTVYFLKQNIKNFPIGLELSDENYNFMDVDYYVFPANLLEYRIINQQLNLNKEVMISIQSGNDLELVYQFFENSPQNNLIPQLTFITSYTRIVNSVFS